MATGPELDRHPQPRTRRAVSSRPRSTPARTAGPVDEVHGRAVKRSVSLDPDLDKELTQRFGRGGKSRFLNEAARDALARIRITELLARFELEDGPLPGAVHDEVAKLQRPR